MTDSLNELSKTLKDHRKDSEYALKRIHKKKYKIERVTDVFDPVNSFRMDFFVDKGLNTSLLDLYFKPPPLTSCCAGDYCSQCEIFNAGEELLQLGRGYIPGSVTMRINGRIRTEFTETDPDNGVVTINLAVPVGAIVRVCYVLISTALTFTSGGVDIGGGTGGGIGGGGGGGGGGGTPGGGSNPPPQPPPTPGGGGSSGGGGSGSSPIVVTTDNQVIDGLDFTGVFGVGNAIDITGASAASPINNVTIQNCTFTGFDIAINAAFVHNLIVRNCTIVGAKSAGVLGFSIIGGSIDHNTIQQIGYQDFPPMDVTAYGIALTRTANANLTTYPRSDGVIVDSNLIEDIPTWEGIDTQAGSNLTITNNTINRTYHGIVLGPDGIGTQALNIICDSNVVGHAKGTAYGHTLNQNIVGVTIDDLHPNSAITNNAVGTSYPSPIVYDFGGLSNCIISGNHTFDDSGTTVPPPPPPPTGPIIKQFPGTGANTPAAFESMMRDMSLDIIEIAGGTYLNWHLNIKDLTRATKPLLVRPAAMAKVIWDDTGGGTGVTPFLGLGALYGPGTPTFACDYITFDSTGTGGSFTIQNYSLGSFGLIYTGWVDHVIFSGFIVRNCGGTAGLSHSLYVSSDNVHHSSNLIASNWNVATSPNLTGFQCYNKPNVINATFQNWVVDSVHRAAYIWADASNVTVNGWTITNSTATFDTSENSTGVIKNCHATNSGPLAPGQGYWLNTNVTDGGGNTSGAASAYPIDRTLSYTVRPSIPSLPPIGSAILDATWQTHITRVGTANQAQAYATLQAWNTDGSKLLLALPQSPGGHGTMLDGNTFAVINNNWPQAANTVWSNIDPNKLYSVDSSGGGNRLYRQDGTTGTLTAIHSFSAYTFVTIGEGEGSISDDDHSMIIIGHNGGTTDVIVFDPINLSTVATLTVGGLDNAKIAHSGNYVVVIAGNTTRRYSRTLQDLGQLIPYGNHGDTAIDTNGRDVFVTNNAPGVVAYRLDTGAATIIIPAGSAFEYGHTSGRGPQGWILVSVYDTVTMAGRKGNDQLLAAKLDTSGIVRVYGFANHGGDDGTLAAYNRQPHATLSRDGTKVAFVSEWGGSTPYPFVAKV